MSSVRNGGQAGDAALEAGVVTRMRMISVSRMSLEMSVLGARMRSVEPVRHHTTS